MKKTILIIITTLFIILGVSLFYQPLKSKFFNSKDSFYFFDLPWMDMVLESVCFLYYEVPEDLEMIIKVAEKCIERNPEYFAGYFGSVEAVNDITLPNLKKYKNRLFVTSDEDSITLHLGEDEAYTSLSYLLPCTSKFYIGEHPVEYYLYTEKFESGRYFDKENYPFVGSKFIEMNEDFSSQKEELDNEMKDYPRESYIFEEREVPIYQFLEYKKGDKLYDFCDKQPLKLSLPYYRKFEELSERICEKYDLSRIIFRTFHYLE